MIRRFLSTLGLKAASATSAPAYEPYEGQAAQGLYNLLFCDEPALFENGATSDSQKWRALFASPAKIRDLQEIAADDGGESRVRALAFHKLREQGVEVPTKRLLGVIVEVPFEDGLDVLAAYADGSVRYLNRLGRAAIFEGGPQEVVALARDVLSASTTLIQKIGPWKKARLPPPEIGNVRLTFVVSDGLYFGEGPFESLQRDSMGGPILVKAAELLRVVISAGIGEPVTRP